MVVQMVFQIILLLGSINTFLNAASLAKPSCQAYCGNIIPFPFGIGADCYYDDWYAISCKENFDSHKPFLRIFNLEVLEISLQGTVRINHPIFSSCTNSITTSIEIVDLAGSPFSFSYHNRFIAIGCSIYASMKSPHGYVIAACISACKKFAPYSYSQGCYGFKCCQTTIPRYPRVFNATIGTRNTAIIDHECKYAFLVEQNWFKAHETNTIKLEVQNMSYVPVVLEWGFSELFFELLMSGLSSVWSH